MKFSLKKWGGGVLPRLSNLSNYFLGARSKIFSYFSSKFLILKKGFTLVELSIVLLVLALLVSTLLVGRQIIDRAKVQQVISEIDYYTKNFQMFRDQYDFLPGALGVENCKKYPEFSLQKGDEPTQYPSQCDDPTSQKTLLSESTAYTTYKQANFSMVDMVVSGMVENRSPGDRRRKKFDIATVQETTCVSFSAVRDNYYKFKNCNGYTRGQINGTVFGAVIWGCSGSGTITVEHCKPCSDFDSAGRNKGIRCDATSGFLGGLFNKNCSSASDTYDGYGCDCSYSAGGGKYDYLTGALLPLSTYGLSLHKNEKVQECETKTIPGEPRLGYLLKQDEIENQANKSSFDSKTWISYTGGKVDNLMIYGAGNDNIFSFADNDSVIVFFHFDPDKNELTDDGAVSAEIYNLIVKKLGEKTDNSSIGNTIAYSKSSGQGFNFGYIMR